MNLAMPTALIVAGVAQHDSLLSSFARGGWAGHLAATESYVIMKYGDLDLYDLWAGNRVLLLGCPPLLH